MMMNNHLKHIASIVLLLITCLAGQVLAQTPARKGPASAEEIKEARTAVEADMNDEKTHHTFISTMGLNNPLLVTQYENWMKKYPNNINIPMFIGAEYHQAEMPQAKEFLERAAAMEPKNATIWRMLSDDAFIRGERDSSREYLRKATLAEPSNATYAYGYLWSFSDGDPNDYKQKVFDFVKRFPASERGAEALCLLADSTANMNDRINYFEELRRLYPPQKFQWSDAGMEHLADNYLQSSPEKALALINDMRDDKDWKLRKQVAESLIQAKKFEKNQNYNDAAIELTKIRLPHYNDINDFIILKISYLFDKAGNTQAAYDSMAVKFAKTPTDRLNDALNLYGKKLGMNKEQVAKNVETLRYNNATPAYPFDLEQYNNNEKLSLESLKGKVVLLTFWFPACNPCRAEFPHFQAVINKFKSEDVAYIGINVSPQQDPYVLPFLRNTKFSFIPLRGNPTFALKNFGVDSEPENFLIDKDGKIVFRDFRIDDTNHRTLELMIASLLQKGQPGN